MSHDILNNSIEFLFMLFQFSSLVQFNWSIFLSSFHIPFISRSVARLFSQSSRTFPQNIRLQWLILVEKESFLFIFQSEQRLPYRRHGNIRFRDSWLFKLTRVEFLRCAPRSPRACINNYSRI